MAAYYNEIDPLAAALLRELVARGMIAPGDVDERSIIDVQADELMGYTQCHFFAGGGVWSLALRDAGWPDDRRVWTGSCPCQPFSAAGKGEGFDDARHLWPVWYRLIRKCRPATVFGEQVAERGGPEWLDLVHADLEATDYAVGALDLCAAGFGAPHRRQRFFFVADTDRERRDREPAHIPAGNEQGEDHLEAAGCGASGNLANAAGGGRNARRQRSAPGAAKGEGQRPLGTGARCELVQPGSSGLEGHSGYGDVGSEPGRLATVPAGSTAPAGTARNMAHPEGDRRLEGRAESAGLEGRPHVGQPGPVNGFWGDAEWVPCRDGKARPIEPGTFPLAHGSPARVGRLRVYGNAIVAPVAEAFIRAYLEVKGAA